jgi:hypothetical protein
MGITTMAYSTFAAQVHAGQAACARRQPSRSRTLILVTAWVLSLGSFQQASLYAFVAPPASAPSGDPLTRSVRATPALKARQPHFVLSPSLARALEAGPITSAEQAHFSARPADASQGSPVYVACTDATGIIALCPLTAAIIPQLSYSSLSGLPTIPTAVASLARVASDYSSFYVTPAQAAAMAPVQSVNGQTGSITGLATAASVPTAVAQLTRSAADYQSVYDAYGAASSAQAASAPLSMIGAAKGIASLDSNSLIPIAQIPVLPYDRAGAAATAVTSAETYAANASNLSSGTINAALLPNASPSSSGIVRCDGVTITCASGVLTSLSGALLPPSGIVNATSPTTATSATSAQIAAALNTGPTTQLATALIPTLNQNTTGTAANAVQVNSAPLPVNVPCVGTNSSGQLITGACSIAVSGAPLGKNVTTDFGATNLVANGTADNSAKLQAIVNSVSANGSPQLNFPCGTYYFSTSVLITGNLLSLIGEGTSGHNGNGCVNIQSDQPIDSIWEVATANQSGGANLNGPRIEHFNFRDISTGGNQVRSGLKITDENNLILNDVNFQGFLGNNYATGAITLTSGSSVVTCTGCSWTASMAPGVLQYGGYPYEVVKYNSPTSLTLAVNWPLATVTSASGAYSLHYKGIGLWLYPGYSSTASAYDFTQYGTVDNIKASQTWNPIFLSSGQADSLNSHEGTSRVAFNSGYLNCGLQDSIGVWMGVYTDTTHYHVSENNCSFGAVIAGGHSNDIMSSKFENSGASATVLSDGVSTCSTGSPSNNTGIPCTKGILIMGVSATTGSTAAAQNNNNEVAFNYFAQYGNDVEVFAGSYPPQKSQIVGNQHISTATNAVLDGGINSQILEGGMVQLFNNVTQQTGTGIPTIPCGNATANHVGSKFYNTNGSEGTTEYICRSTGWIGVE